MNIRLREREQVQDRIQCLEEDLSCAKEELRRILDVEDRINLRELEMRRLRRIINRQGTGRERQLMDGLFLDGELSEYGLSRLKTLSIQFLHITL